MKEGSKTYMRLHKALDEIRAQGMDPERRVFAVDVLGPKGNWMRG